MGALANEFKQHRRVIVADSADPTDDQYVNPDAAAADKIATGAFDTQGYDEVLLAMNYANGGGVTGLSIVPLWWDADAGIWYRDTVQAKTYTTAEPFLYALTAHGKKCFIKVTAISGDVPSVNIRYALKKTRSV